MASPIGSTQRNWTEKIERLFKQPNRRSIYYGSPNTALPHARSYPPSEVWRSVFYHTVLREVQAGDNRGRRYLRIDFSGLDIVTAYEYPSADTAEAELTPTQLLGHLVKDNNEEWAPGLSLEAMADRLLAKVIHIPSTACTSTFGGKSILLCELQTDPEYKYFSVFRPSIPDVSGSPSTMESTTRAFSSTLLVSELADGLKKLPTYRTLHQAHTKDHSKDYEEELDGLTLPRTPLAPTNLVDVQRIPPVSHSRFSLGDSVPCKDISLFGTDTFQPVLSTPTKSGPLQTKVLGSRLSLVNRSTGMTATAASPPFAKASIQSTRSKPAARRSLDLAALFWPSGSREPTAKQAKRHSIAQTTSAGSKSLIGSSEASSRGEKTKENAFRPRGFARGLPRWKP
ncbi:hypothetical protein OF83DRAFT_1085503 [Amylostereum chailletii]|nr:hypothetical protein OF83DRAFT_1085503 [Amylostereum chailletii]